LPENSLFTQLLDEYHEKIHDHDDMEEESDDEDMEKDSEIVTVSSESLNRLGKIIADLRKKVPVSAEAPGEQIAIPKTDEVSVIPSHQSLSWKKADLFKISMRDILKVIHFMWTGSCSPKMMWMIFATKANCHEIIV
jgi:hypothetical protein